MTNAPLILFERVTYAYGARVAVHGVDLAFRRGEYVALLGRNGSGKSTLARLCNALLVPSAGRVLVNGEDTRDPALRRAVRDLVGMIFQNPDNQIVATLVEDDVAWGLAARGWPVDHIRERVAWALEATGLAELRSRAPHRLSGGQRQRLALAAVLALRPAAIIADEATAMLDPLARREALVLFHRLSYEHGITIVHATHLIEEALQADRVVVLEAGRVALDGVPIDVFADLERLRALGLLVPEPLELAVHLRAAGLPLEETALTVEALASEIARTWHQT